MITIANLQKSFGSLDVLEGIDLTFPKGKATAILGPNASGKTTLLKCILGLVRPDDGEITVKGEPIGQSDRYRRWIGYMPQIAQFPENLTAQQVLTMIIDLREEEPTRKDELIETLRLSTEMEKQLKTLSGGTRQKVSAVIALMFDPDIIILDEPTAGLDPLSSSVLKDYVQEEKKRGKTLLLTSHIMSEIEEMADRVAYLLNGQIQYDGTLDELTEKAGEMRLERAVARMMENGTSKDSSVTSSGASEQPTSAPEEKV